MYDATSKPRAVAAGPRADTSTLVARDSGSALLSISGNPSGVATRFELLNRKSRPNAASPRPTVPCRATNLCAPFTPSGGDNHRVTRMWLDVGARGLERGPGR